MTVDELVTDAKTRMDKSVEAMRHVYGVGARKADDLGEIFLAAIRRPSS